MTGLSILVLFLLGLAHFLGDYTHLSNTWMLKAKSKAENFLPILAHAGVHATLYLIVGLIFTSFMYAFMVAIFQLAIHFIIDVLKGKLNVWYPNLANPANKYHWYVFGADQFLHFVALIVCAYFISM